MRKNNLMATQGSDMSEERSISGQLNKYERQDSMHFGGMNKSQISSASGKNPFHPRENSQNRTSGTMAQKQEERKKIAEEWGWEKEETVQLWEARAKARKGVKKPQQLTADEKLKRFR